MVTTPLKKTLNYCQKLALFVDGDIEDNPVATDITGVSRVFQEDHSQYQIYTAEFDKVIPAESMVQAGTVTRAAPTNH